MEPLTAHFTTFLFLLPIGIHRFLSSSSLYLHNPSQYRSKPWFFSTPRWKSIDLYLPLIALPIAYLTDLIIYTSSSDHSFPKFHFLQQSLLHFLFWVLLILIIFQEFTDAHVINEAFIFLMGGVFFLVEYFLNGEGFMGVSEHVYDSLGELSLICGCCCFYLAVNPSAFFADFFLSGGIVFKATWVLQAGLSLYTDEFGLKGCSRASVWPRQVLVDVKCDLKEDGLRGIALMDLVFVVHAIGVFVAGFGGLLLMSWKLNLGFGGGDFGGPLLSQIDSESLLLMAGAAELEME